MIIASLLSLLVMLTAAVAVVVLRSFLSAVAALSVVSLALSVLFTILRAPDVAMAEAAVGAGLSGLLLTLAARRLGLTGASDPAPADSDAPGGNDPDGGSRA
jgi:uncharacterized MnhB-related membrane protein